MKQIKGSIRLTFILKTFKIDSFTTNKFSPFFFFFEIKHSAPEDIEMLTSLLNMEQVVSSLLSQN